MTRTDRPLCRDCREETWRTLPKGEDGTSTCRRTLRWHRARMGGGEVTTRKTTRADRDEQASSWVQEWAEAMRGVLDRAGAEPLPEELLLDVVRELAQHGPPGPPRALRTQLMRQALARHRRAGTLVGALSALLLQPSREGAPDTAGLPDTAERDESEQVAPQVQGDVPEPGSDG